MNGHISARGKQALEGAIDLHVHPAPSTRPRLGDAWDIAASGESFGMRGAVLKDHDRSTIADAYLTNHRSPYAFESMGSMCLNASAGGLNAAAVESAALAGVRMIYLPTKSAANDAEFWDATVGDAHRITAPPGGGSGGDHGDTLRVAGRRGLTAECRAVLEVCKATGMSIGTGHLSAREVDLVVQVARDLELPVVVTHAPVFTRAEMDRMRSWADAGALLELVWVFCCSVDSLPAEVLRSVTGEAALIEAIGAEHFVLSSDLGQVTNPPPAEGLAAFASGLLAEGISETDLQRMLCTNPATYLGLDDRSQA